MRKIRFLINSGFQKRTIRVQRICSLMSASETLRELRSYVSTEAGLECKGNSSPTVKIRSTFYKSPETMLRNTFMHTLGHVRHGENLLSAEHFSSTEKYALYFVREPFEKAYTKNSGRNKFQTNLYSLVSAEVAVKIKGG